MAYSAFPFRRPWAMATLVFAIGASASALWVWRAQGENAALAHARFVERADAFSEALAQRVDAYTDIAFGLRGLFLANPNLSRRDFVLAAQRLDIANRHPEIKNLAFTRYVRGADKDAFVARVRADTSLEPQGYPGFAIRPPGERAEYFVADYLWPLEGNQGIHGLDISAQPVNLASMRYAQSSGKPVASGPFDLLQETSQRTGFVIRVPVFRSPGHSASDQAPADFMGAVAVTLRVRDVIERLRREGRLAGLLLYLSDGGAEYSPQTFAVNLPLYLEVGATDPSRDASYRRELSVFGRKWRVEMAPGQSFLSASERNTPLWQGLVGMSLSLLAALVSASVVRQRSGSPAVEPDA
ncbi:CHASE domain-containing protein [Curvibacter sp. APW13]|uniref:CHASE domain-containing protein n=1 Tax=Curvibacter sp. APW13 TaxID=3077236 RepID=UPI0028DE6464|nr:CHASE domain-containing protein [Curvibacter sp. APW13]MDT8990467.1 CHASE domain-containing protein [Curvibacter sp. APW13]